MEVGKPVLLKREGSLRLDLYDYVDVEDEDQEENTWFLLFATKKHWKENTHGELT